VATTHEADFVVLGSGIGGLSGAIRAVDGGLSVLILERSELLGGVCSISGGELWVAATYLEREAGIEDSIELAEQYLDHLGAGHQDKALQLRFLHSSPEALEYYAREAGVRWQIARAPDGYHPAPGTLPVGRAIGTDPILGSELGEWQHKLHQSPGMPAGVSFDQLFEWGGFTNVAGWDWELIAQNMADDLRSLGPGLMAYFVKAALVDRSIPVLLETRAERLTVDVEGAVIGVRAVRNGEEIEVRARRGVLIATGGYDWNAEMTRAYEQIDDYHSACPPIVTGDHLTMGSEIGAQITVLPPVGLLLSIGFHIPGEEYEAQPLWRYLPFEPGTPCTILVNDAGQRFCDESHIMSIQVPIREFDPVQRRYRNQPAFIIFDQNHRDRYPLGPFMPGQDMPENVAKRSETLGGLATELGIDPAGLESTVKRFNEFAHAGVDEDFNRGSKLFSNAFMGDPNCKPNPNMGPLEKPPYYGFRVSFGGVGLNSAGLRIDEQARVVHMRGHAIPGLYATSNAASYADIGPGTQSGITNARAMTWGYIAGRHAAGA
jgi:3-oxosteroid 1-dehydrogenase